MFPWRRKQSSKKWRSCWGSRYIFLFCVTVGIMILCECTRPILPNHLAKLQVIHNSLVFVARCLFSPITFEARTSRTHGFGIGWHWREIHPRMFESMDSCKKLSAPVEIYHLKSYQNMGYSQPFSDFIPQHAPPKKEKNNLKHVDLLEEVRHGTH